jgi:hypothetical protein
MATLSISTALQKLTPFPSSSSSSKKQNSFVSFPISIQNPNSIRLPICHATAKSQTGPVKKRSSSSTASPNTNKKKKRRSKGGSGDNLNLRDVEIVKDDGGLADVQVDDDDGLADVQVDDDDDDDSDDGFYSDSVSRKVSTHPTMPLPKPPAGFVVDDSGRVLLASTKRIVTMVISFLLLPIVFFFLLIYNFFSALVLFKFLLLLCFAAPFGCSLPCFFFLLGFLSFSC